MRNKRIKVPKQRRDYRTAALRNYVRVFKMYIEKNMRNNMVMLINE